MLESFETRPRSLLYLLSPDTLPTHTLLTMADRERLRQIVQLIHRAFATESLPDAHRFIRAALKLIKLTGTSAPQGVDGDRQSDGLQIEDYGTHLAVRPLQTQHPAQYLVINLLTAYQELLTTPAADAHQQADQKAGLQACAQLLARVFNLSEDVT